MTFPVDPSAYLGFFLLMVLMGLSPGPAILFCIRTGLAGQWQRVMSAVAGLNSATLVWFIACALGLHLIILHLPLVFHIIALLGGAYVIWMAYKTIKGAVSGEGGIDIGAANIETSNLNAFKDGFLIQFLNPKLILFFTAILPPFVDIHRPVPPQMVLFAASTLTIDGLAMSAYGLIAARLAHYLADPKLKRRFDMAVGCILGLIGMIVIYHSALDLIRP